VAGACVCVAACPPAGALQALATMAMIRTAVKRLTIVVSWNVDVDANQTDIHDRKFQVPSFEFQAVMVIAAL
jgi:L-asparagine transporter-like permease